MSDVAFDKIHAQRLSALADHLESGQLLQDKFDFSNTHIKTECGTVGCAIGEAALLWPEELTLKTHGGTYYHAIQRGSAKEAGTLAEFFGLETDEFNHLFEPNEQDPSVYGGTRLGRYTTPQDVAAQIRAFLEYKAQEVE